MMDATPLYPEPFHPVVPRMKADWSGRTKPLTRAQHPVRYYFIDFGQAERFDLSEGAPSVEPVGAGGEQIPPEYRGAGAEKKHDPFPTDVWYLGNLIQEEFLQVRFSHRRHGQQLSEVIRGAGISLSSRLL
jgi:hypothetical protein